MLSTEDHQELMQSVASKSAAQFSLIPTVSSMSSENSPSGDSESGQADGNACLKAFESSTKIAGDLLFFRYCGDVF